MTEPRRVQASQRFWSGVIASFGHERGPLGEPSRFDFRLLDYPDIMRVFAELWGELPTWQSHPYYRVLVAPGRFGLYSVIGQLEGDGSVTLVDLGVDLYGPDPDD